MPILHGVLPVFEPPPAYIIGARDAFCGSALKRRVDPMSNIDIPSENKQLSAASPDLIVALDRTYRDETLFDYLVRTGKAAFRDVPLFADWKRPKRPKPTFSWPPVPPLF